MVVQPPAPHHGRVKRAAWIGGATTAALATAAPATVFGQTMRDVNFATLGPSAGSWPFQVAEAMGFYKKYGLNIQYVLVSSTAAGAQLLLAKGADIFNLSATQTIEAVQGGGDLKLYSNTILTPPYSLVASKQYKKASDIKGKSIVVGGVNDFTRIFAERIMQAGGVAATEYDETYAGATSDRYAALHSGSVAAAILFPPWDFRAVADGGNIIGTVPAVMQPFPYDGLAARTDFAAAHPDIMLDFLKAEVQAVRFLYNPANRAKSIDILATATHTTTDDAARTYDELITKYKSYSQDSRLSAKQLDAVIGMLGELKVLQPPYPPATTFFDNRFVIEANRQVALESK
jgi:ABC-type nitrate/sulfonate/bicarbonate transport system substrate-binding protein